MVYDHPYTHSFLAVSYLLYSKPCGCLVNVAIPETVAFLQDLQHLHPLDPAVA